MPTSGTVILFCVWGIEPKPSKTIFLIIRKKIFEYIREREELVIEPFHRLVAEKQLIGYPYDGFWASMDTFKDKQQLEGLSIGGIAPWEVWKTNGNGGAR